MKILITYVSAGAGHRRAAEAIYNYFKKNCPELDLEIIDELEKTNFIFKNIYSNGYLFLVNHSLWLWQFIFWISSIKFLMPFTRITNSFLSRINSKSFIDFVIGRKPDIVISTHFMPSEIICYLNKTKAINSQLITVITDFGVHPFWIINGTHMYAVASDSTKKFLVTKGVDKNSIIDSGIPVDPKFLDKFDRNILAKKFGLEPDKFTILISTGSSGIGEIEELIKQLHKDVQIFAVCASNKILYDNLKKHDYPQVRVFAFIENMQEIMAVSDMIITKPGGLTISESLAMGLYPIFITAIPGQEAENVKILTDNSIGVMIKDMSLVKDRVLYFKGHPEELRQVREKINKFKRPFAVKELCNVICQGSTGASCRGSV